MGRKAFKKTVAAVALLGIMASAQAQDTAKPEFKRNEIGISAGAFPIVGTRTLSYFGYELGIFETPRYEALAHHKEYDAGGNLMKFNLTGAFSAFYIIHNPKNSNCLIIDCSWARRSIEQSVNGEEASAVENYLTSMIGYKVSLKEAETYSLYSAIAAGLTFILTDNDEVSNTDGLFTRIGLPFQATFLGVNFGKNKDFGLELGLGVEGLFKMSYNYKF